MLCHICGEPAIGQCRDCHEFHCGRHGRLYCVKCRVQEPPAPVTAPYRQPEANAARIDRAGKVGAAGPCASCGQPAARTCPVCGRLFCTRHRGWRELKVGRYKLRRPVCSQCSRLPSRRAAPLLWLAALLAAAGLGVAVYWLMTGQG
jgi:hypothetical protein